MAQSICETKDHSILEGINGDIFQKEYSAYTINASEFSKEFSQFSVKVILGNWCEDSQREVPRFIKIMSEFPPLSNIPVTYYLVDENKFCADPEVQALKFQYVPAFIFYRNGEEIGRIIETPEGSMEKNINKIIR